MYPLKNTILNVDFALKLRIYSSLKSFICLKWILKNLSTTLHTKLIFLPYKAGLSL